MTATPRISAAIMSVDVGIFPKSAGDTAEPGGDLVCVALVVAEPSDRAPEPTANAEDHDEENIESALPPSDVDGPAPDPLRPPPIPGIIGG